MLSLIKVSINSKPLCKDLISLLNEVYMKLSSIELHDSINTANTGIETCKLLKTTAINEQNEPLANASLIMSKLFSLYKNFSLYWIQLLEKGYKNSWDSLQDTIDDLIIVSKWTDDRTMFYLDILGSHFKELEKLYPYKVFASVEMVVKKVTCSICGRDVLDFECTHIPANLYWGEMAHTINADIMFQAIALVKHPMDKRCIMEVQGDDRSEIERFKILDYFVSNITNPLTIFSLTEQKRLYLKEPEQKLGRNDKCYCRSGLKYKLCCGKEKYEEGTHLIITPKSTLGLELLS